METPTDAPAISAVDIRLPAFWTTDPQLWFLQVESQFTARRIATEITKYHHVVASLPPTIAREIRDLLVAPPAENACTTLKQLLISRLTPSEPQRLQQLLHDTELGDRTPSQLLRHMRQLLHTAGATTTEADSRLLRELFLQRLPVNVRMVLASAADKRLSQLAELADSVLAVAPPSVAALQPDIVGRAPTTALHDIREQISRLADTVAAMQARSTPEERQRPAAQQRTCWYHRKHGNAASKCIPPCDYAGNGSGRH
ncbi:uncharacterized protein LOC119383391 [Rhipicephalus sanguineus]|uniref:uncharacterized protein LOC119383391 n=1 Tax=Rhipicephalus sanguineus TaxID=34632 RepID=UPI0018942535|nr:uncharacterized protein LOC119383391 [Rhipicephalus sanguineus]